MIRSDSFRFIPLQWDSFWFFLIRLNSFRFIPISSDSFRVVLIESDSLRLNPIPSGSFSLSFPIHFRISKSLILSLRMTPFWVSEWLISESQNGSFWEPSECIKMRHFYNSPFRDVPLVNSLPKRVFGPQGAEPIFPYNPLPHSLRNGFATTTARGASAQCELQ